MSRSRIRQSRLRLILITAAALGSSSATMSGAIGALASQQPVAGTARIA